MIETTLALSLAFGALNAPLANMAQLKTQSQVPPAPAPSPTAPADAWKKILDTVKRDGREGTADGFSNQTLTGRTGDLWSVAADHGVVVSYFTGANGVSKVLAVEFTLSIFTSTAGTLRSDDWTIITRSSGKINSVIFNQRVKAPGDDLSASAPVLVDPADPKVKAIFDEMLQYWSTR